MKQLLLALALLIVHGVVVAQSDDARNMECIDSLIMTRHHYDPRVVKIDTAYFVNAQKVSEHYFVDTTTHVLERAVVQVYHSPTNSTIDYYFFLDNELARVQSQNYKEEKFSDAEIHYFHNNTPIDCSNKDKRACELYVQKAREMVSKLKQSRS